jgi:hypothetical protein
VLAAARSPLMLLMVVMLLLLLTVRTTARHFTALFALNLLELGPLVLEPDFNLEGRV